MKLAELFENYDEEEDYEIFGKTLTEEEVEVLSYLIHDKRHVFKIGRKDPQMESVLAKFTEQCNTTLYRGVNKEELDLILSGAPINYYTSYSEDASIAKRFGEYIITLAPGSKAFNFQKIMGEIFIQYPNEDDPEDSEMLIDTLKTEKEWVMEFNLKLVIKDKNKLIFKYSH